MNHAVDLSRKRRARLARALLAAASVALVVGPATRAFAGGFEVPENTTKSVARGGTGAVNKRDPSALYFNPALLPRARGAQVLLDANLVNMNLKFQRDPLQQGQSFEPVENKAGIFPAPFLTASWDLGTDDFTLAAGVFGPSAYGTRCYGKESDSGCSYDPNSAGRYMMVDSSLLEIYTTVGAGYRFHLGRFGNLSVGLSGMASYLTSDFTLAVHGAIGEEKKEDPGNDSVFTGKGLSDWAFTGVAGLAYDYHGFRLAASYRPPISWKATGTATMTKAPNANLGNLTDNGLTLNTAQAGSLRVGFGMEAGTDPGDADLPRYDVEFNMVWEDWSRVDYFKITPAGDVHIAGDVNQDLSTIYQTKGYQDTYSFRFGGSYAVNSWLIGHLGGYYETGAQTAQYTNLDFVSWNRIAAGAGATFRVYNHLDLDVAYMHVFSPDRHVTDGKIYEQAPLAGCNGPNYSDAGCTDGHLPTNPQNDGTWSSSFQLASFGVTYHYD